MYRTIVPTLAQKTIVLPIIKLEELSYEPKPLAQGQFGSIYLGKCREKPVAIKILDRVKCLWDDTQIGEFIDEVSIMTHLSHPNIVQFMGACIGNPSFLCNLVQIESVTFTPL